MTLLRIDGFDHQNTFADLVADIGPNFAWRNTSASTTIQTPGLSGTGKCIIPELLVGVLTVPLGAVVFGCAVKIPQNGNIVFDLFNSATGQSGTSGLSANAQVSFYLTSTTGSIEAWHGYRNNPGSFLLVHTGNNVFATNQVFFLEFHVIIHPTLGQIEVKIGGNTVLSITNANTSADGTDFFDSLYINNGGGPCQVDDFYILDTNTGPGPTPFNTFVGPSRVCTLFPASGVVTQFTPLASTNVSQVQETAMDSDTTYNSDNTLGQKDLFTITPLPPNVIPIAAQVTGAYRQDAPGTRQMASHLSSGGTEVAGTSELLSNVSYVYQHDVYPYDVNGTIAWTVASIDAAEIGYAITV